MQPITFEENADAVAAEFGCKGFGSVEQMLTTHSELQAASVAAPTVHHLPVARQLMKAGVDVPTFASSVDPP